HTTSIRFVVKLTDAEMQKSLRIGLLERFKLVSSLSLANMVAFDPMGRIKKYNDVLEIIKDFYYVRLEYYQKRKDYMTDNLQNQLLMLSEQARFIKMIIEKQLSVANKKKKQLVALLEEHNFTKFSKDGKPIKSSEELLTGDDADEEEETQEQEGDEDVGNTSVANIQEGEPEQAAHVPETIYSSYDYLLGMAIWSLTYERFMRIMQQRDQKEAELNALLSKSAKDLWNQDLDEFLAEFDKFLLRDEQERESLASNGKKKSTKRRAKATATKDQPNNKKVKVEPKEKKSISAKPVVKKEASNEPQASSSSKPKEKDDILSFFSSSSSSAKKITKPSGRATSNKEIETITLFSDDDDDEDIFNLNSSSSTKVKKEAKSRSATPAAEKSKKSKSSGKQSILDELEDLEILGNFDKPEPKERRTRETASTTKRNTKKKPVIIDSDDEDEDEEDDIVMSDGDDDDDFIVDE
ncbi:DNA gyrase/topoisomerase IV, subunit A family protein, partial [Candida albicans]